MTAAVAAVAVAAVAAGAVAFSVTDPRVTEASGLAPGLRSPGIVYVQNDSGDRNRIFALSARDGHVAATVTVRGAVNVDWEDLAVTRDAAGTPSVWVADIGDNGGTRDEVRVYRIDEPRVGADERDRAITSGRADVWRLRYPSGATDAESLAVAPGGTAYLVTKSVLGASVVYRVPPRPDPARVQPLTEVARVSFSFTGTPGGPNPVGQLTATGAAFSRDGRVFAVRTYTDAYLWRVGASLARTLASRPVRVALPAQPQGESIAVDGDRLLLGSEGVGQPVYSVPLPALPATTPAAGSAAAPTPVTSPAADAGEAADPGDGGDAGQTVRYLLVGGVVVLVAGAALLWFGRRRR